jgi:2-oxoglutarate dehydrogenase E2 component (dihydrolipoamide succinyltransferase)
MSDIKVPSLGESVTEAIVGKWHKKVGDRVKADDLLVELETDKISLEVNAESDGMLEKIDAAEGTKVTIGTKLGVLKEGAVPEARVIEQEKPQQPASVASTQNIMTSKQNSASPAAQRLAQEKNVNLKSITGSGREGRITKGDILISSEPTGNTKNIPDINGRKEEKVKMTKLRQRIAERLKESQNTAAILTTFNEVDMSNVMSLRNKYKDLFAKKHNVKLGFMSFFVKAAVTALKEIPAINAEIKGDDIVYKSYCDVSIAVGTEKGLVVPILRNADKMSFADIELGVQELANKAKDGKLTMEDLTGGTFSITNGGIYGSLLSTPIINPPQSGILGMHSIQDRPVVLNNTVVIRPMMYLALSYDHRIVDGKEAVTFLVRLKELIESPDRLLFDI